MSLSGPDSLLGQTLLGRYRVEASLGHGGMGTVFSAFDERLARTVVVKVPRAEVLVDERLRARFLVEVRDLSTHEHPNILGILDFGEHEGVPFAVMQHLGGGDLSERLDAAAQSPAEVLTWLRPLAAALDFIHETGCLHRDVKPSNILFDDIGNPFLADFGIATVLDHVEEGETDAPHRGLTATGGIVGSGAYSPPESVDRVFLPAFDQYSLATVVYLAIAGELPFEGDTAEALLIAKYSGIARPLASTPGGAAIDPALAEVVACGLARDPLDRYPSCTAFAEAFAANARAGGSGDRQPRPSPASADTMITGSSMLSADDAVALQRSGRGWIVWLALAAAIAAGGVLYGSSHLYQGGSGGAPSIRAELGSRPSEIAEAMQLCLNHGGACTPGDFAGEDVRTVWLEAGQLDATEVTHGDFLAWADGTGRRTRAERHGSSFDGPLRVPGLSFRMPLRTSSGGAAAVPAEHPVVHVSVDEAHDYCESRGARLPSADEWEHHARGDDRRIFPWGDAWDDARLDSAFDGGSGPGPVGRFPRGATPEGLLDLAGNVWEWTSSRTDEGQVIKGGSWDDDAPTYFRGAAIGVVDRDYTSSDLGFRCFTPVAVAAAAATARVKTPE